MVLRSQTPSQFRQLCQSMRRSSRAAKSFASEKVSMEKRTLQWQTQRRGCGPARVNSLRQQINATSAPLRRGDEALVQAHTRKRLRAVAAATAAFGGAALLSAPHTTHSKSTAALGSGLLGAALLAASRARAAPPPDGDLAARSLEAELAACVQELPVLVAVGPSGAGKTSMLRELAGAGSSRDASEAVVDGRHYMLQDTPGVPAFLRTHRVG